MSRAKRFDQSRLRIIFLRITGIVDMHDGFDRQTAGFLPAFIAAHAVGNHRQPALAKKFRVRNRLPIKIRIFIVGALAANVGQARHFDSRFCAALWRRGTVRHHDVRMRTGFCGI